MNILKPLEILFYLVLNKAYLVTHSYGYSLIILSIFFTVITYPLYFLADIWKRKEDAIQLKMKDDITKIKNAYTGQKRFYLIQTTYRFYNYKFWFAFRTSLGLLIQIPFFFAAYGVLSHFQGFQGVSFGIIKNLGEPDKLFFGINLLPIVMTIINIISSVLYSRSLRIKDNLQLVIMALCFFVLLYNSPSALLVYWTMNNILSLIKSYFQNRKKEFKPINKTELLQLKYILTPIFFYTSILSQLFFIDLFPSLTKFLFLANLFFLFLVYILYYKTNIFHFLKNHITSVISFAILVCMYLFKPNFVFFHLNKIAVPMIIILFNYFFVILLKKNVSIDKCPKKSLFIIVSLFSLLLCVILPLITYFQNPTEIATSITSIFITNLLIYLLIQIVMFIFIKYSKNRHYNIFTISIIFMIFSYISNVLFPLNVGIISGFNLTNAQIFIDTKFPYFVKDLAIGIVIIVITFLLLLKKPRIIILACSLLLFVNLTVLFSTIRKVDILDMKNSVANNTKLSDSAYDKHIFSVDNTNIIYIVADMFNSEYIEQIKNEIPTFSEDLAGFTWYKDTLSVSGWTETSLSAIYAGDRFSPLNLNNNEISVRQGQKEAFNELRELMRNHNYKFSIIDNISAEADYSEYAYEYCKINNINLQNISKHKLINILPIFNTMPTIFKKYIYDDARWLLYNEELEIQFNRNNAIKSVSYLSLLPNISSTNIGDPNFLYFRTELPHTPYGIDEFGEIILDDYTDKRHKSFVTSNAAYYSAKKTMEYLAIFFKWLKENNIYDNTLIIICSDHGNNCFDNNLPIQNLEDSEEHLWKSRANALYMIKPVNSKNTFTTNSKTVKSNGDIIAEVLDELKFNHNFEKHTKNDIRYYSFMLNTSQLRNNDTNMKYATYKVNGSMFNPESWERIYN